MTYTIRQGDHLSSLAEKNGFADFETIWEHPENAALREKRKNPHVLFPGEQLFIPDKAERIEACATDQRHVFRLRVQQLKLRIALRDFDEKVMAGVACEFEVDGVMFYLESDDEGVIEAAIPRSAKNGVLRIRELDLEYPVRVGDLDPVEEDTGWQARLVNLGYFSGDFAGGPAEQLREALEEFQCDHKIPVTGELDGRTRAALNQLHGV